MKKVMLKPRERRLAHLKVLRKVTVSKGYYLFHGKTPQMECDQEVKQQMYGNASLCPPPTHTHEFECVSDSLKDVWGGRRHHQHKLINLTQAFSEGATIIWGAPSHPSSGMFPPLIRNVFFFGDTELLLHAVSAKLCVPVCVFERDNCMFSQLVIVTHTAAHVFYGVVTAKDTIRR